MSSPGEPCSDDTENLVRCSACPTVGHADDYYCPACGSRMLTRCRSCGTMVRHLMAAYCTRCGVRLHDTESGDRQEADSSFT